MENKTKKTRITNDKDIEICVIGKPSLKHLDKTEARSFYTTLLNYVIEHYKSSLNKEISTKKENENGI